MAYSFRPYSLDQAYLLPQAPRDWLPEGHLAFFLEETVSLLDLRPIFERYRGGRGPRLKGRSEIRLVDGFESFSRHQILGHRKGPPFR